MRKWIETAVCLIVLAMSCRLSAAQTPVAILDGNVISHTLTDGVLTCNVGQVTGDSLLRIQDLQASGQVPTTLALTEVVILGTTQSATARLRVQISNPSVPDFVLSGQFPTNPIDPVSAGIVTLGTIDSNGVESGGISIPDAGLRNATVLALSASGNLYGTIAVGRVFRVQATNTQQNNLIAADITAHAPDAPSAPGVEPTLGELSIGVITTTDGITR